MPELRKKTFITQSSRETRALGREIGRSLKPGAIILLYGELGSGKTVFTKGLCRGLGVKETVTSPSFVLVTEYRGRLPVTHIDLYRLDGRAAGQMPIEEYFNEHGLTVIEWAERLSFLPRAKGLKISIKILKKNSRELRIEVLGH
jgi:tRNA threonylcarbamoyladenosine biosynthesis protein TsaE